MKKWSEDEIDFLVSFSQNPEGDSIKDAAKFLGRSYDAVKNKLSKLRKAEPYVGYLEKRFTDKEVRIIRSALSSGYTHKEIGKIIGVDEISIRNKISHLGLTKEITPTSLLKSLEPQIRQMADTGYTRKEIAEKVGLKYSVIKVFIYSKKIECRNESREKSAKQKEAHRKFMRCATRRY